MGRPKLIDRNAILDAAEAVVCRDGASKLTVEAVAQEAGISKASVLYDYGTKQGLIRAVIGRQLELEDLALAGAVLARGPTADAHIRAYVDHVSRAPSDEDRAVTSNLCALLREEDIRQPVRDFIRRRLEMVVASATSPRGAALAFLAVEGLLSIERFGVEPWSDGERTSLIADIAWLATHGPEVATDRPA